MPLLDKDNITKNEKQAIFCGVATISHPQVRDT
jgi:hypothetical protein